MRALSRMGKYYHASRRHGRNVLIEDSLSSASRMRRPRRKTAISSKLAAIRTMNEGRASHTPLVLIDDAKGLFPTYMKLNPVE